MDDSSPPTTLYRIASFFLVLCALAHALGHYLFYVNVSRFGGGRKELYDVMEAYIVEPMLGASMWTMLQMFSLAFALLLAYAGIANLILLAHKPTTEQLLRLALFHTSFFLVALVAFSVLHPVTQPLVIASLAAILFGASYFQIRFSATPY